MNTNYFTASAIADQIIAERRQEADAQRLSKLALKFRFGTNKQHSREDTTAPSGLKPTTLSAA